MQVILDTEVCLLASPWPANSLLSPRRGCAACFDVRRVLPLRYFSTLLLLDIFPVPTSQPWITTASTVLFPLPHLSHSIKASLQGAVQPAPGVVIQHGYEPVLALCGGVPLHAAE